MTDPETTRAMIGAVDEPKKVAEASPDFATATQGLAEQLDGCIRTLVAIVDKHTGEIAALPPRALSSRRHDGHTIWRARAFQLRGLQQYFEALSRADYAAAATVEMDRYGDGL